MARGTWQTTSGGGSGSGGTVALAIGAAIAVVALAPLLAAAVIALVKALVIAIVMLAVTVVAVWRLRSRRPVRELPMRRPLPQAQARVLPAQPRPAIEMRPEVHLHIHGADAETIHRITRQLAEGKGVIADG